MQSSESSIFALSLLSCSCSLLFDEVPNQFESDASIQAVGQTISPSIGPNNDFPDYSSWLSARAGDLTQRQLLAVDITGALIPGEEVVGVSCSGYVRQASAEVVVDRILSLDLTLGECRVNDRLKGVMGGNSSCCGRCGSS